MGRGFDTRAELRDVTWAWWLLLLVGLLGIAAGIIVLAEPEISLGTLAVVTGIFLLVDGIFEVAASLLSHVENRGMLAVFGVVSAIAGVILIRHPFGTVAAAALLLGLWLIVAGVLRLIRVFDEEESRGWNALVALIELGAGIAIVASPGIGVATLALLVGIAFIVRGVGMCAVAWFMHGVRRDVGAPPRGAAAGT